MFRSEKISGGFIPEPHVVGSGIVLSRKDARQELRFSQAALWINPAAACEFLPTRAVVRHGCKGLSSFEKLACLQSIESAIRRKADGYRTELNDATAAFVKAKFTDCSCSFIECVQELIIRLQRCVQWGHTRAR
jgi:hypothetical protein